MSTYVLMRILESAPHRYELGIRLLTFGSVDRAYERLTSRIESGQRVLDLGCGTGALTLRAARRGAQVKGIDVNPEMLEVARAQVQKAGLAERVELVEMGVAELDGEKPQSYDAVMTGLCLSELSHDEIRYTLEQVRRILRPGGLLLIADEVTPRGRVRRLLHALLRAPLVVLTYVITQQTTHAIANLTERLRKAGLVIESTHASGLGSFLEIVARAPAGTGR